MTSVAVKSSSSCHHPRSSLSCVNILLLLYFPQQWKRLLLFGPTGSKPLTHVSHPLPPLASLPSAPGPPLSPTPPLGPPSASHSLSPPSVLYFGLFSSPFTSVFYQCVSLWKPLPSLASLPPLANPPLPAFLSSSSPCSSVIEARTPLVLQIN